jgi:hypothetical protein
MLPKPLPTLFVRPSHHTLRPITVATLVAVTSAMLGCGGGGGEGEKVTADARTAFPSGLALASPTSFDDESSVQTSDAGLRHVPSWLRPLLSMLPNAVAQSATPTSAFAARVERLDALLNGAVPTLTTLVKPELLVATDRDAGCYGPALKYLGAGHPDAPSGAADGELPPGDVGLWIETDATTGDACAAAQLNARMTGAAMRGNQALRMLAILAQKAAISAGGLPSAGAAPLDLTASMPTSIPGLSFTQATIGQAVAGTYDYAIKATLIHPTTSRTHAIELSLTHATVTAGTDFNGLLKYAVTDQFTGGNCPGSTGSDVTWVGTLRYDKSSETELDLSHRSGMYCGKGSTALASDVGATYESDGQLDPASKLSGSTGWGNNFSRFAASLNPNTEAGRYVYAWQAGPQDSHSRTLQVNMTTLAASKAADTYFGYGVDIADTGVNKGLIQGMFCNWAGPGNGPKSAYTPFAQRQIMSLSGSNWAASVSNILYAPTNSCTDTSSTSAWLDRNVDGTVDASDGPVSIDSTTTVGTTQKFLIDQGTDADIKTRIGFTLPSLY